MSTEIGLGEEVRDTHTGFRGVVTGKSSFLYATSTVLVVPSDLKDDGLPSVGQWFDLARVERVTEKDTPS